MVLAFLKAPAGIVCHALEPISRGYILLELEILSFLLKYNVKLFFRVTGFVHLLRMFSRFYPHF